MRNSLTPKEIRSPETKHYFNELNKLSYEDRKNRIKNDSNEIPLLIYRYLNSEIKDARLEDYLLNSYIWMSSPLDFNDPFGVAPYISMDRSPQILYKRCYELVKQQNPWLTLKLVEKEVIAMSKDLDRLESFVIKAGEKSFKEMGIISFSEINHNILMWSHYANNHKGFVLEFDIVQDFKNFLPILKVDYSNEYPSIDWSRLTPADTAIIFTKKHKGWEYEKEWRCTNTDGANTYLEFKPETITGLIFGCRAVDKFKQKILKILKRRAIANLSPINISCAIQHDREFRLTIKKDQTLDWPA